MTRLILDTGPLVAYLRKSDHRHDWAKAHFQRFPAPFWTCEPVLTEAAFLLTRYGGNQNAEAMLKLLSTVHWVAQPGRWPEGGRDGYPPQ